MTQHLHTRPRARLRHGARGLTVLIAASFAAVVLADAVTPPEDTLEEVTVTAQRRQENSRDVPISLTVFSAAAIEQQNFQGVESYFDQTPNVSFISEGTRDRKELALRGVSDQLSPDNNIKEGSFGFYIDDFNVARARPTRKSSTSTASRCCAVRRAPTSAGTPWAVPSTSPPSSRPTTSSRRRARSTRASTPSTRTPS